MVNNPDRWRTVCIGMYVSYVGMFTILNSETMKAVFLQGHRSMICRMTGFALFAVRVWKNSRRSDLLDSSKVTKSQRKNIKSKTYPDLQLPPLRMRKGGRE